MGSRAFNRCAARRNVLRIIGTCDQKDTVQRSEKAFHSNSWAISRPVRLSRASASRNRRRFQVMARSRPGVQPWDRQCGLPEAGGLPRDVQLRTCRSCLRSVRSSGRGCLRQKQPTRTSDAAGRHVVQSESSSFSQLRPALSQPAVWCNRAAPGQGPDVRYLGLTTFTFSMAWHGAIAVTAGPHRPKRPDVGILSLVGVGFPYLIF